MEKRDWSLQRTRLRCSRVQWQRALHHCIRCFALNLVIYGFNETHSMKLSAHCSWGNLKATWSLEVCELWLCRKLVTSAHCAPQNPLTPLCHFTWPSTSWLRFCRFQSLPLFIISLRAVNMLPVIRWGGGDCLLMLLPVYLLFGLDKNVGWNDQIWCRRRGDRKVTSPEKVNHSAKELHKRCGIILWTGLWSLVHHLQPTVFFKLFLCTWVVQKSTKLLNSAQTIWIYSQWLLTEQNKYLELYITSITTAISKSQMWEDNWTHI